MYDKYNSKNKRKKNGARHTYTYTSIRTTEKKKEEEEENAVPSPFPVVQLFMEGSYIYHLQPTISIPKTIIARPRHRIYCNIVQISGETENERDCQ